MKAIEPTEFMTEVELVARAQKGDEEAYRELFERCFTRVYRVAISYVGSRDEANDVVQSAFINAFRSIGRIREPEKFGAWVAGIARRKALDHIRQRKNRAEVPLPIEGLERFLRCNDPASEGRAEELEYDVVRDVVAGIADD